MKKSKPSTPSPTATASPSDTPTDAPTGASFLPDGDPFSNLDNLRIDPGYLHQPAAKKLLTTVPVRKPGKQDFFRVHPSANYRITTALIELKDEREVYVVHPHFVPELGEGEHFVACLYLVINRQKTLSIWPVRLPAPDGRQMAWHTSAMEAAELAMKKWVRIVPNMNLGANEIHAAERDFDDPEWPEQPFAEILKIAFKGRLIENSDHPVVQRLRGLV